MSHRAIENRACQTVIKDKELAHIIQSAEQPNITGSIDRKFRFIADTRQHF